MSNYLKHSCFLSKYKAVLESTYVHFVLHRTVSVIKACLVRHKSVVNKDLGRALEAVCLDFVTHKGSRRKAPSVVVEVLHGKGFRKRFHIPVVNLRLDRGDIEVLGAVVGIYESVVAAVVLLLLARIDNAGIGRGPVWVVEKHGIRVEIAGLAVETDGGHVNRLRGLAASDVAAAQVAKCILGVTVGGFHLDQAALLGEH